LESQSEREKVGRVLAVLLDAYERGKNIPFSESSDGRITLSVRFSSNHNSVEIERPIKSSNEKPCVEQLNFGGRQTIADGSVLIRPYRRSSLKNR